MVSIMCCNCFLNVKVLSEKNLAGHLNNEILGLHFAHCPLHGRSRATKRVESLKPKMTEATENYN